MSDYQRSEVVDGPSEQPLRTTVRTRRTTIGPGQIFGGLVGITLTVVGVLAVVRAGIDDTWNAPQANVIGLHQSALVGAGEILLGLLLIAGSASVLNRSILGFTGALVFVAGVAIEAVSVSILDELGTTRSSGAFLIAVGIVAIISAMLPTVTQRSTTARLDR